MNPRTTWFLVLLAAIFASLIVFVERPYRAAKNKVPDRHILPGLKASSISSIQLQPANPPGLRIEKTNGTWELTKPISYPADHAKTEQLLQFLTQLQWQGHITPEELRTVPKARQQYGVDSPQFSIVLQEGESVRHLLIGNTLFGSQMYLQVVGGEGIYLVDSALLKLLPEKADQWRDPRAVPLSAFTGNALEVRSGTKNSFRLEFNPTNRLWRLNKPIDARADSEKIFDLLAKVEEAQTREFVSDDGNIDFEKFGLPNTPAQPPELELLFLRDTNLLAGLQVGSVSTNDTNLVFASRLNHNVVFTLPRTAFDPWKATHTEFRNRRLMDLAPAAVTNIQIKGQDTFTLERGTNGQWRVTQPESFRADSDLIDRELLLFVLSRVEVNFENDVVNDFAPFGLTNPVLEIKLTGSLTNYINGKMDPLVEEIFFGTTKEERVFVRRGDAARRVFSIHSHEFDLLPRWSWQLRDRRIWNFHPTNVVSVTVQQFGKSKKLLRKGENDWSLEPGQQGGVNPFLLEEAMIRLGELKAIFWTARHESDRAKFGFAESDHKIVIEVKRGDQTDLLELEFGSYSAYLHPYAATQVDGKRAVFEFPLPLFYDFIRRDLSIVPPSLPPSK